MGKMSITAKPKYTKNYITLDAARAPDFCMEDQLLTNVRSAEPDAAERKRIGPMPVPMPENMDAVENGAFCCLDSLRGVFWNHVPYRLGANVFSGCTGLETAILAEGTEKVPLGTFSDCTKLRLIRLPRSVGRINMDAFKNCVALKSITLPPELEVIEVSAFWGCRSLEEIDLPDSVTELGSEAFANCTNIKKVKLPASLKDIGACAFQNCTSLESVVIPEGVKSLPMGVFAGCRNLKHIVLPDALEYISPYAFYRCDALDDPSLRRKGPQFPMELLHRFAGEVPGSMLTAMGYVWFDVDRKYQFFLSDEPGIIEVHARPVYAECPKGYGYDKFFVGEALEPLP